MPNFSLSLLRRRGPATAWIETLAASLVGVVGTWGHLAQAEVPPKTQGFVLERLYQAAPGGGWVVMDDLAMRGGLGGVAGVSIGYSHHPLQIHSNAGSPPLQLVSDQAFADFGLAITYDRFRLYLNLDMPLAIQGDGGTIGTDPRVRVVAPSVALGSHPDTLSDARIGFDARLLGDARDPFRLGLGAQLFVPNGDRSDFDTDETYRAMGRILLAGDVRSFVYAGHLGAHLRPLHDDLIEGSPKGSEALFGVAAGLRFPVRGSEQTVIVGPEIYGETAFQSFLRSTSTGLEGLLSARVEGIADDGAQWRIKVGAGGGLNPHFGAPEWRAMLSIELFDHHSDRDKDGISDRKDACPDTPGFKSDDPRANGCPLHRDSGSLPNAEVVDPSNVSDR